MNRLATESSPYLRQHANNPVDWYPWGDEAFERARQEDKPVFVSIGYASCHWCHVMAHESFEDEDVAADLDRSFVSVKVDREERPDVDAIYMAAVQAMTGAGGWPMSVWCTPDGRPFFAGTYFPPADRHGLPAFRKVIGALSSAWRERRTEVEAQADALAEALQREASFLDRPSASRPDVSADSVDAPPSDPVAVPAVLATAPAPRFDPVLGKLVGELGERFDPAWGGFGPAPKFPRPVLMELCLRQHRTAGDPASLAMATTTLDAMAAGGIYDHLAGGFARYSTDRQWLVPHFEKMLTDQALLARAYLHAWQATGSDNYRQVVSETVEWVCDELSAPSGGFCSSVDADADGEEGGHATWTPAEVTTALTDAGLADLSPAVCDWYGVSDAGNWEGRTVLRRPLRAPLRRPPEIDSARRTLLAARRMRPQPSRDDKVLTEWNAMFIAVLAEAAAACDDQQWGERAEAEAEALFTRNRRRDGRWLRSADNPMVAAFAADYAWVIECCTRLGELTGRAVWTERASETAGDMLDLFWDPLRGGLFTTGRDAERLIVRAKDVLDGAVPSAASAASQALLRLSALTGEARWGTAGERLVELASPLLDEQPFAVADMVAALGLAEGGAEVVVTGDRPDLVAATRRRWLPDAVVAWGEPTGPALWEGRASGAAYVCRRFTCREPAYDVEVLERQLLPLSVATSQ